MSGATHKPVLPIPGVSAAIFNGGEVLLVKRAKGQLRNVWSLPGGHIEAGETVLEAIHREILEETDIHAEIKGLVDVVDVILQDQAGQISAHYVLNVFYGLWRSGKAQAGSDSAAVCWINPSELNSLPTTDGLGKIIDRAGEKLKSGI